MQENDYRQLAAKKVVADFFNVRNPQGPHISVDDVLIVQFTKNLENWKAFLIVHGIQGHLYEASYSGAKNEVYLDAYKKYHNGVIPGDKLRID